MDSGGKAMRKGSTDDSMYDVNKNLTFKERLHVALDHHTSTLKKRWDSIPFIYKMLFTVMVVFAVTSAFFSSLFATSIENYIVAQENEHHTRWVYLMAETLEKQTMEEVAASEYVLKQNEVSLMHYRTAQAHTDNAINEVIEFFEDHLEQLSEADVGEKSFAGSLGVHRLMEIRSRHYPVLQFPTPADSRFAYLSVQRTLYFYIIHKASELTENSGVRDAITGYIAVLSGYHSAFAFRLGNEILSSGFGATPLATRQHMVMEFLKHITLSNQFFDWMLIPSTEMEVITEVQIESHKYLLESSWGTLESRIKELLEFNPDWYIPPTTPYNYTKPLVGIGSFLHNLLENAVETAPFSEDKRVRYGVLLFLGVILAIVASGRWYYYSRAYAFRNAALTRNSHIMHEVTERVKEYVQEISKFTLDPPPPPRGLQGTFVGEVEIKLQRCVASLKSIAPAIPGLLFPIRSEKVAQTLTDVRKQGADAASNKEIRENIEMRRIQLLSTKDIDENDYTTEMMKLTELGSRVTVASFMFVDISTLHVLETNERVTLIEDFFPKLYPLIEECIVTNGGILHNVWGDTAVGVWNLPKPAANHAEHAATGAHILASKLFALRRHNKTLKEAFSVAVGITSGQVHYGVFGDADRKTVQAFGPPMIRGIPVARSNVLHQTAVSCDDEVRRSIEKVYPCKPIELLSIAGKTEKAYEVINQAHRREVDLESKLAMYRRAFELYEKKFYREALKNFREYTKQYGYDSSVERIQSIITGV